MEKNKSTIEWNPEKVNKCPKNKKGHMFSIKKGEYNYCEYCGVNQCYNCKSGKEFIKLNIVKE